MNYVEQWKDDELIQTTKSYERFLNEYDKQLQLDKERCDKHNDSFQVAIERLNLEDKWKNEALTDEDKELIYQERKKIWKECDEEYEEYTKWKSSHSYFYNIADKTSYIHCKHIGNIDEAMNKAIDIFKKDIDKHFDKLQAKVENKIGKIIKIDSYGGDDYAFEGEKGKCVVEVILAGGYNIQRLHTRWIVKNWNID